MTPNEDRAYRRFRLVSLTLVILIVLALLGVGLFTYPRETFVGVVAGGLVCAAVVFAVLRPPFPGKGE